MFLSDRESDFLKEGIGRRAVGARDLAYETFCEQLDLRYRDAHRTVRPISSGPIHEVEPWRSELVWQRTRTKNRNKQRERASDRRSEGGDREEMIYRKWSLLTGPPAILGSIVAALVVFNQVSGLNSLVRYLLGDSWGTRWHWEVFLVKQQRLSHVKP
ncbi:hypothetical protein Sjap_021082 [Stephania japonica]|uniref:Uncharacterized protein n=1 Tax=Stephania japonica TaxID=461633 RepID=A0AAP0HW53_9MAGN